MKLTPTDLSYLKNRNINIENLTLILLNTGKRYDFDEIEKVELKKRTIHYNYEPSFIQRFFPFAKFLDYKYYNQKKEIKVNLFLVLKNKYRILIFSSTHVDLITTSHLIKKLNYQIAS